MDRKGIVRLGNPCDEKADPNSFDDILTKYCTQWRGIGLKLGLETVVLDSIEADYPQQRKRLEKTLDAWLKLDQDKATWGVLELAITNANRAELALEPLADLNTNDSSSSTDDSIVELVATEKRKKKTKEGIKKKKRSVNTETDEFDERQLHSRTISRLKGKYAKIVIKIKHILEQQKYDVRELILTLSASDDDNQTIFSTDEAFVKITNTNQLFLWISKYCSMYDYELLLALVESTECEEAIKLLDNFSEELHSSILKDLDLLSVDGELQDIKNFMPGTHKLEIKYIGGKCTLSTMENVKRIIYEFFHLKKGSVIFRGAQEGSVAFIYQISTTVKSHLQQYQITSQDVTKFTDHKISSLTIDEMMISPENKEVVSTNTDHSDVSDVPKPLDFTNMLSKQLNKIKASLSPEDLEATLSTLRKIFDNIIQHPNDDKYHQIKLGNKTFSSKVWRYPACEELMKMSGWVVEDDHVRLRDDSHVCIVSQLLESFCEQNVGNQVQKSSSGVGVAIYPLNEYEALISAVINGNISDIQSLLKSCNISTAGEICCEDGSSANLLLSAILSRKIDVVELLVKKYSVDPYEAADGGMPFVLAILAVAPQSFSIDFLNISGVKGSYTSTDTGGTLFHHAILTCCFDVVQFLVMECGIDVNVGDNDLDTPLHIAYMYGHTHIAEYLIQHGADVMAVNSRGHTPYEYIDGIPLYVAHSRTLQNCRIIHQIPGSAEYIYYIKLRNMGIEVEEAVTLTMEQFPSLTEDRPTQPHHDVDHTSFTKELTQYITKRSSSDQPWGTLKLEQARSLPFMV